MLLPPKSHSTFEWRSSLIPFHDDLGTHLKNIAHNFYKNRMCAEKLKMAYTLKTRMNLDWDHCLYAHYCLIRTFGAPVWLQRTKWLKWRNGCSPREEAKVNRVSSPTNHMINLGRCYKEVGAGIFCCLQYVDLHQRNIFHIVQCEASFWFSQISKKSLRWRTG